MVERNLKRKVVSGFFWQLMQKILIQLISFGVSVVLARILMPDDFGVVALAGMFLILVGIFVDNGLGTALVQKKDADELDYNTVFYSNILFAFIIYTIVYICAPLVGTIFKNPQIVAVIRVMGLGIPISSFSGVPNAIVSKRMEFKKFFFSSLLGSILSAIVGLSMVFMGYGVWALVGQNLVSTIANTIVLIYIVHWKPSFMFSKQRFYSLFSYGWKIMASNVIGTFFSQLKGYAIGLKYSATDLAYYNRGEGVPGIIYNNISASINIVLFPALSQLQEDKNAVRHALSKSMQTASFFLMPLLLGLAAISDNFVQIVYTSKWMAVVPFMQVICLMNCFDLLGAANIQALKAVGHAETLLKLEIYKKPLMLAILIGCMFISPLAIAIGQFVYSLIALAINAYPNRKYVNYPLKDQFLDISNSLSTACIMALIVYFIGKLPFNIYTILCLQIVSGIIIYALLAYFFNKPIFSSVIDIAKSKLQKRRYES